MLTIDEAKGIVIDRGPHGETTHAIDSPEAFRLVSKAWLRCGWEAKYVYSFTWMGRPIIQLPEDIVRIQEVIYRLKPDVLIETGIAHGGSLVLYAGLFKAIGKGRVIGIDIEIRPHNRRAIEEHELKPLITLIEGSSVDPATVERARSLIGPNETVLVLLDSNHTTAHVMAELESYGPLVTPGSYIVAMDGIMQQMAGAARTKPEWAWDNPLEAMKEFCAKHPEFVREEPSFAFNEGTVTERITYWPQAFLKRL
jgi:cephalosporin hydroxylase